jgi:carboxyl-terminal processing protease
MPKTLIYNISALLTLSAALIAQSEQSSSAAINYLNHALDIMEEKSFRRQSVDWVKLRRVALEQATGAQSPADTYEAIRVALRSLGDRHSFLQLSSADLKAKDKEARARRQDAKPAQAPGEKWPPSPYIERHSPSGSMEIIDGISIATVIVPAFEQTDDGQMHVYAETLRSEVARLAEKRPAGWIVDLRGNLGGNVWPMLAGVGPLAASGTLGAFVDANGNKDSWFVAGDGSGVNTHDGKRQIFCWTPPKPISFTTPPIVAVLVDRGTASSGEAVAIAFQGSPHSKLLGRPTHGQSTSNEGFPLPDGANLVLTTAVEADRNGRIYIDGIVPDVALAEETGLSAPGTIDPMTRAAADWIKSVAAHP